MMNDRYFRFEVLLDDPTGNQIVVKVSPNDGNRTLKLALTLASDLETAIPFSYKKISGPDVGTHDGHRQFGQLTVQMVIEPTALTRAEAIFLLATAHFHSPRTE